MPLAARPALCSPHALTGPSGGPTWPAHLAEASHKSSWTWTGSVGAPTRAPCRSQLAARSNCSLTFPSSCLPKYLRHVSGREAGMVGVDIERDDAPRTDPDGLGRRLTLRALRPHRGLGDTADLEEVHAFH